MHHSPSSSEWFTNEPRKPAKKKHRISGNQLMWILYALVLAAILMTKIYL